MTWINRLRLFGGLLGIIAVVAALTLVFNQRQTTASSLTATVATETYDVGAAYGGTVVKQYVKTGDSVAVGDKLFTMQSVSLQQDVANNVDIASSAAYDVDKAKGTLTYKATVAGQVSDLQATLGNALGSGQDFAKITITDSQYVDARYLLTPRDYERIQKGAPVSILLPDNHTIAGTVSTVEVATENGQAATKVRVESPELKTGDLGDLAKSGTPVVATLQLRDDGPLAGVSDAAFNFLRQIGLQ